MSMTKTISIGMAGNVLEWYDFSIYGYFTPIIGRLFFPSTDPFISLISTFAVFAAGFFMRPLGALVFGYMGDRYGRKLALLFSLMLIALPTILMGFLPTYEQVGIIAPLLLVVLRLLQGLSAGGEYSSSILFLTEHANQNRRGFSGSFALFGAGVGMLLGSLASALTTHLMSPESLDSWGWRIPFIAGVATAIYGFYLRASATETTPFLQLKDRHALARNPLVDVWKGQLQGITSLIGFNLLSTIAGYLLYAYMPTYLHLVLGMPLSQALFINVLGLGLFNILVPFSGLLSDYVGRKPLFIVGALAFITLSYPLFLLLSQGTFNTCFTAIACFTVFIALYHGPLPATMSEFFPAKVRASAVAISYNFAASLFSGTCPLVCSLLVELTKNPLAPAYYLVFGGIITLLFVALSRRDIFFNRRFA